VSRKFRVVFRIFQENFAEVLLTKTSIFFTRFGVHIVARAGVFLQRVKTKTNQVKKSRLRHKLHRTLMGTLMLPTLASAEVPINPQSATPFHTVEYRNQWWLEMIHADKAYALGYTGKGVRVAVLDDSHALLHEEFAGRTIPLADLSPPLAGAEIMVPIHREMVGPGVHGTPVAGIIAAARDDKMMHGVAYEAILMPIRRTPYEGWESLIQQLTALEVPLEKKKARHYGLTLPTFLAVDNGAKVLNASYGYKPYPAKANKQGVLNPFYQPQTVQRYPISYILDEDGTRAQLLYAAQHDVITVVAAGNGYQDHPKAAADPGDWVMYLDTKPEGVEIVENAPPEGYQSEFHNLQLHQRVKLGDPRLRGVADKADLSGTFVITVAVGPNKQIASYSNRCGVARRWCIAAPGGEKFIPRQEHLELLQRLKEKGPAFLERYRVSGITSFSQEEQQLMHAVIKYRQMLISTEILTTSAAGGYESRVGTSFAAPLVSASSAILRQVFPYMTARQIIEVLLTTADRSGHFADDAIYGRGLLDLGRAIDGPAEFGADGFAPIFDVNTQGHDTVWRNNIGGTGGWTKRGRGTVTLAGTNSYSGPTTIAGGTVRVLGAMAQSALTVEREGTLSGVGIVGSTQVSGTVAPSHPGQALRVAGDYMQSREGVYKVTFDDHGQADQIQVQGMARLDHAGLEVRLQPSALNRDYALLHAQGGIQGEFAPVASPYRFIDMVQGMRADDPTRYHFSARRNTTAFVTSAKTPNQQRLARVLDQAAAGLAAYDATVMAGVDENLAAQFDRWSGEIHVSALSVLTTQADQLRDTVFQRTRSLQSGAYAQEAVLSSPGVVQAGADKAIWAQYTGAHERFSGNDNVGALKATHRGLLFGTDTSISATTQLGALAGFEASTIKVDERSSHANLDSYLLGAYGSSRFGVLQGHYGASYQWHKVSSRRDTGSLGLAKGAYRAGTAQAFAEVGLPARFGQTILEPYAAMAYVATRRAALEESGLAGLQAQLLKQQLGFSTLGGRTHTHWELKTGLQLTLHGGAGWRHAYGKTQPVGSMQFAQGDHFEISGTPVARNALLLEAGIGLQSMHGLQLRATYMGQRAPGVQLHAITANVSWKF
jgi:subtilase-type serine protease